MKKPKLTVVSSSHYFKLVYRSILFTAFLVMYIRWKIKGVTFVFNNQRVEHYGILPDLVWLVFIIEMILRFFPSATESPGCQKQFARNYSPTGRTDVVLHDNNAAIIVLFVWIILNLIFGALYMSHVLDDGFMLLLCLAYSVCDMICILFFCPFQTWFLKNKCCVTCRIYNWDYAMMFTPLFFIKSTFSWTLLGAALCLLIRWEVTVWRYPERFSENTNRYLDCKNCTEKLCAHKTQLARFRITLKEHAATSINRILKK